MNRLECSSADSAIKSIARLADTSAGALVAALRAWSDEMLDSGSNRSGRPPEDALVRHIFGS